MTSVQQLLDLEQLAKVNDGLAATREALASHVREAEANIRRQENEIRLMVKQAAELKGRKVRMTQIQASAVQTVHAEEPHRPYWERDYTSLYNFSTEEGLKSVGVIDHIGYEWTAGPHEHQAFMAVRWGRQGWCYKVYLDADSIQRLELLEDEDETGPRE